MQQTILILNTVILITALVVAEIVYGETPKKKRAHLRYFYPVLAVLVGILIFAVIKQVKAA